MSVECSCCPEGKHVKCQKVIPGMTGGFPCSREPLPGTDKCAKHVDRRTEGGMR